MNYKHGKVGSPVYRSWSMMIQRCTNPKLPAFENYGGRGIMICERWTWFENFYADMGNAPPGTSLDRIDNDGDYKPENCRWATASEQRRNRRDSKCIAFNGEVLCVTEWSVRTGIKRTTIMARLAKGWPVDLALTKPPMSASEAGILGGIARHA